MPPSLGLTLQKEYNIGSPAVRLAKLMGQTNPLFQLTVEEERLRSQSVTLKTGRGQHRKYPPYAFTEQGVAMLSSVLNSPRAVQVNIAIMRTFVLLRQMLASNEGLARKLAALEKKYDAQFKVVFDAIRQLMAPQPPPKRRQIEFNREER